METFQAQLEQVEQVLKTDPSNQELTSLAEELKELISLTEQSLAAANPTKSASTSRPAGATNASASSTGATPSATSAKPAWAAGDECLAKYSGDDKWYPARITSVGGSEEKRVYSVVFKGYNSTELVAANALKRLSPSQMQHFSNASALPSAGTKRKLSAEEEVEREKKKKKNEKKLEVRAAKAQEQDSKKASWQKFATKSVKKGVGIAGVAGTSIFKTPDNPLGKGEPFVFDLSMQV